jgi:hypothetical protein
MLWQKINNKIRIQRLYCMDKKLLLFLATCAQLSGWQGHALGQVHGPNPVSGGTSAATPSAACPAPAEVTARHLYGIWTATLFNTTTTPAAPPMPAAAGAAIAQWTLELGRHEEFADGVFGRLARGKPTPTLGQPISGLVSSAGASPMDSTGNRSTPHPPLTELQLLVAGDVDDGVLTLEESADGTTISATWLGEVVPGSCGKTLQGHWSSSASPVRLEFQLVKQATW